MPFTLQVTLALRGTLDQYDRAVAVATTGGIRSATTRMKNQGRRQMERAGLGTRLPNAFRGTVIASTGQDITRRGIDEDPTGTVRSTAIVKARGVDLIEVFQRGVTIQGTPFLAIPTREAGGRRAKPPRSFPDGTFRFVPLKRGRGRPGANTAVAVLVHKVRKEVWYTLLPSVRIKKRLNLDTLYTRISRTVEADIDRRFARALVRLGVAP